MNIAFLDMNESDIGELADGRIIQRGYNYFRDEAVLNPVAFENRLVANVLGTDKYRTLAEVKDGHLYFECSCPYGSTCKHVIALLYEWVKRRKNFTFFDEFKNSLKMKSREELVEMLEELASKNPDFVMNMGNTDKDINTKAYKKNISHITRRGYDYYEVSNAADKLRRILKNLEESNDRKAVIEILRYSIPKLLRMETETDDSDAFIADVIYDFTDLLKKTMKNEDKDCFFPEFIKIYLSDNCSGYGFDNTFTELLVDSCKNEAELKQLEKIATSLLKTHRKKSSLVNLLLEIYDNLGENDKYIEICKEMISKSRDYHKYGYIESLLEKLIAIGNFEDALAECKKAIKYNTNFYRQLAVIHENTGDKGKALDSLLCAFMEKPHFHSEKLSKIKSLSKSLGKWAEIKKQIIKKLEDSCEYRMITEIGLKENDLALASKFSNNLDRFDMLRVAKFAEKKDKKKAIVLYKKLAFNEIGMKSRGNYREAAKHLKKVKNLLPKNMNKEWASLIIKITNEYCKRIALMDELRKAGLI